MPSNVVANAAVDGNSWAMWKKNIDTTSQWKCSQERAIMIETRERVWGATKHDDDKARGAGFPLPLASTRRLFGDRFLAIPKIYSAKYLRSWESRDLGFSVLLPSLAGHPPHPPYPHYFSSGETVPFQTTDSNLPKIQIRPAIANVLLYLTIATVIIHIKGTFFVSSFPFPPQLQQPQ